MRGASTRYRQQLLIISLVVAVGMSDAGCLQSLILLLVSARMNESPTFVEAVRLHTFLEQLLLLLIGD